MRCDRPKIVAVCGFSSNVGKTTLICELLQRLPGWEAIKLTRGHYRSCGKDPLGCCVSDLLGDEALIRTGREQNYEAGKDTGRFWDAGASNVHWVIANDNQVEEGILKALERVTAKAVLVEGNSFLDFIDADVIIICARADGGTIKSSARRALARAGLLYISSLDNAPGARRSFEEWQNNLAAKLDLSHLSIFTHADLPQLVDSLTVQTVSIS